MNYRKLLELYKNGQLQENERQMVESDIEKQEAISEYLFEREESMPVLQNTADTDAKADAKNLKAGFPAKSAAVYGKSAADSIQPDFVRMVNRSIRRAFLKMGAAAAVLALAGVLFIIFALPKVIDCFYYDPGAATGEYGNQMSLDLAVYTELRMPGYSRDRVIVQDRGYGNYDIMVPQWFSYTNTVTNLSGRISKGNLTFYDPNLLNPPAGNVFAWFQIRGDSTDSLTDLIDRKHQLNSCSAGSRTQAADTLKALNENTLYTAYVTLDRMMPYETFLQFLSQLAEDKKLSHIWCAVCTNNGISNADSDSKKEQGAQQFYAENLGFYCELTTSHELDWDKERYPELILQNRDILEQGLEQTQKDAIGQEDFAVTHVTSMLRYIADQKAFLEMMEDGHDYRQNAEYIEKNGLTVYGFAGIGTKETLLQLNQEKAVYEIYTLPLR